ncbi:MAG: nucleotidyl transferase AbiEii/AbiGii toxin family protein [Candidatus Levybacteria bacterium]|nr:nucleotidyl transferase AbiEii/AbiGii toxin family protein [Candidatus Levybacteria bacterium]
MISEEQIKKLATKYQTIEPNIRREYFQHLFLSYFYQQEQASTIYFKGGTALRILYKSPRFSEDLDFTASMIDVKAIESLLIGTLAQLERENISVSLKESTPTSGGFLAIISFNAFEQVMHMQLEISLRVGEKRGEILAIASDYVPAYNIFALAKEQLVDEKIQALLNRKKPRDFYDLYFIMRANLLPPQKKDILHQVLQVLQNSDLNFEHELKLFLPKTHWLIIRDFKNTLEREIRRAI